jgi:aspartate aminotransferase
MPIAARRMSRIKTSPAAVITAQAMEMARAGRDVIALSAGEPDFDGSRKPSPSGRSG